MAEKMVEKMTIGKEDVGVVSATGIATLRGGNNIEQAMADVIHKCEKEAKAIWEDAQLSVEEKHKQIAAVMNPDAIRERKLAVRKHMKEVARKAENERSAAASNPTK